jgi:hypothetical protein
VRGCAARSTSRWLLARVVDHDHDHPAQVLVVVDQGLQVTRQFTVRPRRLVAWTTVDRVPITPPKAGDESTYRVRLPATNTDCSCLVVAGKILEPQRRQVPCANHPPVAAVQDPGGSLGPPQRLSTQEHTIGQLAQQLPDLFAVAAQHRLLQRWIGHQFQQPSWRGVDRQGIDQLDRHGAALAQRLDRLLAAHGRAGQDPADWVVTQAREQAVGLLVAGNRQRAVVVRAGPVLFVAGMSMTDEVDHRGPPAWLGRQAGTTALRGACLSR